MNGSYGQNTKFSFEPHVRRSRPEVVCKKSALKDFVKLTEKHLCQCLFFKNVAGLSLLQTLAQVFSCEF